MLLCLFVGDCFHFAALGKHACLAVKRPEDSPTVDCAGSEDPIRAVVVD